MRTSFLFKVATVTMIIVAMFIWAKSMDWFLGLIMYRPPSPSIKITLPLLFFSCIVAPVWEELAFRHIPARIATIINPQLLWPVLGLSCIIFGFGHGHGVMSLLYQGVLGLGFTWVYVVNKNSYWTAVAAHSLWNLVVFVI